MEVNTIITETNSEIGSADVRMHHLAFLGNGRCYHTIDWYRSAQRLGRNSAPPLITDLIEGESFKRLLRAEDRVELLFRIDPLLLTGQSRFADVWRNCVKLFAIPFQVWRLRQICRRVSGEQPGTLVVHAHSMYYLFLARLSGVRYVGTPQGSEVLIRPYRSLVYRLFARVAMKGASFVTVDSASMQRAARSLFGIDAILVQNGIDVSAIGNCARSSEVRDLVLSVRAVAPNYRIDQLLKARKTERLAINLSFCYPFVEAGYKNETWKELGKTDIDLGRLDRPELYKTLSRALLAISIPRSDSSPRTVYEAIFCGCAVAVTAGNWLNDLPRCMKRRLIVVDLESTCWLRTAVEQAKAITREPYAPSDEALRRFDQTRALGEIYDIIAQAPAGMSSQ